MTGTFSMLFFLCVVLFSQGNGDSAGLGGSLKVFFAAFDFAVALAVLEDVADFTDFLGVAGTSVFFLVADEVAVLFFAMVHLVESQNISDL
jgi:hypothetical protein